MPRVEERNTINYRGCTVIRIPNNDLEDINNRLNSKDFSDSINARRDKEAKDFAQLQFQTVGHEGSF